MVFRLSNSFSMLGIYTHGTVHYLGMSRYQLKRKSSSQSHAEIVVTKCDIQSAATKVE